MLRVVQFFFLNLACVIFSTVLHAAKLFQEKILKENKHTLTWYANILFGYEGGAQRRDYKLSELCLLCTVYVLIDKAKSFEKIISFCIEKVMYYETISMTTNDLDSAVYSCTSRRFCISITLTSSYMSKFDSSSKYASKTTQFLRSRLYLKSPTCG